MSAVALLMLPAVAFFGRNVLTGAAVTSLWSDVHVASVSGEEVSARRVPASFAPSTYLEMHSVTWTRWGRDRAEAYARLSSGHVWERFSSGRGGWVHARLTCPVEQDDGVRYFGRYEITWLTEPPEAGLDGWEEGGTFTLFEGGCEG